MNVAIHSWVRIGDLDIAGAPIAAFGMTRGAVADMRLARSRAGTAGWAGGSNQRADRDFPEAQVLGKA